MRTFHWSRTFAVGNGIVLAPLPLQGRFPHGYALGGPGKTIDFAPPQESNIRIRHGFLEIIGPPSKAKFIFDVEPGWLAYLSPTNLFFAKKFPVSPERPYGELAANNASIWYSSDHNAPNWPLKEHVTEIEAIGPLELIPPGNECSFCEDWWLHEMTFPFNRNIPLDQAVALIGSMMPVVDESKDCSSKSSPIFATD